MSDGRAGAWEGCDAETWRRRWNVPEVHLFRQVPSTNDIARERAEAGARTGTLVLADEQTAGRGRRGRTWQAGPGQAILLSMLFRIRTFRAGLGAAPLRVGLALAETVEEATGVACRVKWPNDILVGERKLAGILCESADGLDGWLVAGIGLNVRQRPDDFPPELRRAATSVVVAAGFDVSRAELASRLVERLRRLADVVHLPLDADTLARLRPRDALAGRRIAIDDEPAGHAEGFDPHGALRVRDDVGLLRLVHTGSAHPLDDEP